MHKIALVFGFVWVGLAVALFFYGPPASAPVIPAPESTPESLKQAGEMEIENTDLVKTTTSVVATSTPKPISRPAEAVRTVSIENMAFEPAMITINAGDMIVWTNKDDVVHTATGRGFDSGDLAQGESYAFRFEKAGTYSYSCTHHPNVKGTVVVK